MIISDDINQAKRVPENQQGKSLHNPSPIATRLLHPQPIKPGI